MPIALALITAAAAYKAANQAQSGCDDGEDMIYDTDIDTAGGTAHASPEDFIDPQFLEGLQKIELLPLEQTLTMLEWPISTVTFFRSSSQETMNEAIDRLERRVHLLLQANPWLAGWLVRGKGKGSFDQTPRIWYDPSGIRRPREHIVRRWSHCEVGIDVSTPYVEYESILRAKCSVKTNPEVENRRSEPLFRVSVVSGANNERDTRPTGGCERPARKSDFALIVSMSHICGDGHTFYNIYNSILGHTPVVELDPRREMTFTGKVQDKMGKREAFYVSHISNDPAWMKMFQRLGSDVSSANRSGSTHGEEHSDLGHRDPSKLGGRVFMLNKHYIGNLKAAHLTIDGSVKFDDIATSTLRSPMVPGNFDDDDEEETGSGHLTESTNDILVSWLWQLIKPNVGLMAVNFRGRIDSVNESQVGNYANTIAYTDADYASPMLIRKSLETCRRAGVDESGQPTVLPRAHSELTFSVATNWSSFAHASAFKRKGRAVEGDDGTTWFTEDIELIRHLPIVYPKKMLDRMPRRMSFFVIFSSGEDIGCFLIAPQCIMNEIDCCGIVKEVVAEF